MSTFLRLISVLIGTAGVIGGIVLLVEAQPGESYAQVDTVLVSYGVAAILSGLFWSVLGLAVAKALDAVQGTTPRQAGETNGTSAPDRDRADVSSQDVEQGQGLVLGLVLIVVVAALILVVIAGG